MTGQNFIVFKTILKINVFKFIHYMYILFITYIIEREDEKN